MACQYSNPTGKKIHILRTRIISRPLQLMFSSDFGHTKYHLHTISRRELYIDSFMKLTLNIYLRIKMIPRVVCRLLGARFRELISACWAAMVLTWEDSWDFTFSSLRWMACTWVPTDSFLSTFSSDFRCRQKTTTMRTRDQTNFAILRTCNQAHLRDSYLFGLIYFNTYSVMHFTAWLQYIVTNDTLIIFEMHLFVLNIRDMSKSSYFRCIEYRSGGHIKVHSRARTKS